MAGAAFRIAAGEIHVAGSDLPGEEMQKDIRRFSSLDMRFQLVTPDGVRGTRRISYLT